MTQSLALALAIASGLAALSPLVLKLFPQKGLPMAAISFVASLVIAIVAGFATGELKVTDLTTAAGLSTLLLLAPSVYAVQQAVFHVLSAAYPAAVTEPTPAKP